MNVTNFPNRSKSQNDALASLHDARRSDPVVVLADHRRKMMPGVNAPLIEKPEPHTIRFSKDYWLMLFFFCGCGVLAVGYDELYMLAPVAYTALLAACGFLLAWIYQQIFLETFLLLHFTIAAILTLTLTLGVAHELSYVLVSVIVFTIILKLLDWL